MNLTGFPILELIAFAGIIAGPIIAYLASRRKIGAEVLLIDINAIKGWSEQRRSFEKEIACLHNSLRDERSKRRSEREIYLKKIDEMRAELHECMQGLVGMGYTFKYGVEDKPESD